ncbi:MAG: GNAT family N-acetyltransferase [Anaerolineae bacterium]
MQAISPTIESDPRPQDVQFLEDRINDYNFETTGITDGKLLSIFLRDSRGAIRAGIYGWTWGGACEIRFLWIHVEWRGQGIGRKLMGVVEEEARNRGCGQVVLDTHSFQAPEFYNKLGYEVQGVVEEYPRGHQKIYLCKRL